MSYADEYSDDDQTMDDDSNLVKKLRAKIDELSSQTKELEAENNRFHTEIRKQSLSDMLAKRGYAAKVATFVPADVELTDEGIDSWLAEYGDAFTPSAQAAVAETQQETVVVSDAAQANALRRMNAVESTAAADQMMNQDVLGRIESATNMDELVAALRGA